MQLPQLRLQTTQAKIDIQTSPIRQTIEQPHAQVDLQQPAAEMSIRTVPSQLSIDQTKAWSDMNLKHISQRIAETAQKGVQEASNGIKRRSMEGDELMKIENKGNPIKSQAAQNSKLPTYEFNIGFVPSPFSVNINVQPGKANIEWNINKVNNNTKAQKPVISYQQGEVNVGMSQQASLSRDITNLTYKGLNGFEIQI